MKFQFDENYLLTLIDACTYKLEYMNKDNHLLIDAREFPKVVMDIKHPKEICPLLPKEYFYDYCDVINKYDTVIVFIHESLTLICPLRDFEGENEEIMSIMEKYVRAYSKGLLKEAWEKSKKQEKPVIFAVLNGEASIIEEEDVKALFDIHPIMGSFEEWYRICVEKNPNNLSFLYIDQSKDLYWYDFLSEEYIDWLKKMYRGHS